MDSRQIVLVSTAGFSVLNTGIFWREAKTKRLFSQCLVTTASLSPPELEFLKKHCSKKSGFPHGPIFSYFLQRQGWGAELEVQCHILNQWRQGEKSMFSLDWF